MVPRASWDPAKAASNFKKHGISFVEAGTAFEDPLSLTIPDPDHSGAEERFILIGMSVWHRLLVVSHADYGDEIRIIGARVATRRERRQYEEDV
jgi:uncharacterized DUF497 family protein